MTEEIIHLVLRETNRKGMVFGESHEEKGVKEFDAFVAILLYAGLTRSNHEPAMEL